jgi:hypothetical protein
VPNQEDVSKVAKSLEHQGPGFMNADGCIQQIAPHADPPFFDIVFQAEEKETINDKLSYCQIAAIYSSGHFADAMNKPKRRQHAPSISPSKRRKKSIISQLNS